MTLLNTSHPSDFDTGRTDTTLRIAGAHGYRLDGDQITLWAEVGGGPAEIQLALWAMPVGAADADPEARILVSQVRATLPDASGGSSVLIEGLSTAGLPSGKDRWQMVLALSRADSEGGLVLQDTRHFALTQVFVQPQLVVERPLVARPVAVGLQIDAVGITNPRAADNLSGSLCLELWALSAPYTGGAFVGRCLGRVEVGQLSGQSGCDCLGETWASPDDRASVLVLMLREWTQDGLLTRDHRVVTLAAEEVLAPAPAPARAVAPTPTPAPAVKPRARPSHLLNVNLATEEQLVAIDGLNRALAKAVVAARPFASMDDLLDIKGVGDKRLARMRRHLSV
jgi:hypothetical protein